MMNSSREPCVEYPEILPPSLKKQIGETFSGLYLAHLALRWRTIKPEITQHKRTVMVIPGFLGGELSITALKHYLRQQGHYTYSWGQGFNDGKVHDLIAPLTDRLKFLSDKHGQRINLVGWSLGGIIARELARTCPELIQQVTTLGSPVIGGPKVTALKNLSPVFGWDPDSIEKEMQSRYEVPINSPIHAIYSKADGIVSWQACIDHWSPDVRHHEVNATHIGMGFSLDVFELIQAQMTACEEPSNQQYRPVKRAS